MSLKLEGRKTDQTLKHKNIIAKQFQGKVE